MAKRGRPKGTKKVQHKVVDGSKAKVFTNQEGDAQFVVINEDEFYTFTNTRPGNVYFTRETGKVDIFEGYETKEDITSKEYEILVKSKDFAEGWLVLEGHDDEEPKNANSASTAYIVTLLNDFQENKPKIIKLIDGMTSDFAIRRLKELLIKNDVPSSLTARCDVKLAEIEEEFREKNKAPIHTGPRGEL